MRSSLPTTQSLKELLLGSLITLVQLANTVSVVGKSIVGRVSKTTPTAYSCDKEVYDKGKFVGLIRGVTFEKAEQLCSKITEEMGVKTDWHSMEGYIVVKTLGDVKIVKRLLSKQVQIYGS